MDFATLLANRHLLLLECVSGSHAYGLETATSDVDLKGVFFLPRRELYGLTETAQVQDESNDTVYYELGRFVDLLVKNNPTLLELLATPEDCVRFRHPLIGRFRPETFLSKRCEQSFAGYAEAQIRRARGLNKKIVRPFPVERQSILDFCRVVAGVGSVPLPAWLAKRGWRQDECGLTAIPHVRDGYALYHASQLPAGGSFPGIVSGPDVQRVRLASVPKGLEPLAFLHFNQDAYTVYCREHREYWEWVEKRNEERYQSTLAHGKSYDAKNLMHTFRLLAMALEIAREGRILVRRPDRERLLQIRRGELEYDDLMRQAEDQIAEIHAAYQASALPAEPDVAAAEEALVEVRSELYRG